jgi:hypothetical protein
MIPHTLRFLLASALCLLAARPLLGSHRLDIYAVEPAPGVSFGHSFAVLDQTYCFSWMPAGRALLRSQPGCNWSYQETVIWAARRGARVYYVGSCSLDEARFQRALLLLEEMQAGRREYRLLGFNCIQAIALISGRPVATGFARGIPASQMVLDHLKKPGQ